MKCKCPPDSPFHWRENPRPSMFYKDAAFRAANTSGLSASQKATEIVEKSRAEGKMAGFLKGISKNREEEILRMRNFSTFTLAVTQDAKRSQSVEVPPVRGVDRSRGDKTR